MSRIKITELQPGELITSSDVNETHSSWETATGSIDTTNIRDEAFDRRSIADDAIVPAAYWNTALGGSTFTNHSSYDSTPDFEVPNGGFGKSIDLTVDNLNYTLVRASFEFRINRAPDDAAASSSSAAANQPVLKAILGYSSNFSSWPSATWTTIAGTERFFGFHQSVAVPSTSAASGMPAEIHPDGVYFEGTCTLSHLFSFKDSDDYAFGLFTTEVSTSVVEYTLSHLTMTVELFTR